MGVGTDKTKCRNHSYWQIQERIPGRTPSISSRKEHHHSNVIIDSSFEDRYTSFNVWSWASLQCSRPPLPHAQNGNNNNNNNNGDDSTTSAGLEWLWKQAHREGWAQCLTCSIFNRIFFLTPIMLLLLLMLPHLSDLCHSHLFFFFFLQYAHVLELIQGRKQLRITGLVIQSWPITNSRRASPSVGVLCAHSWARLSSPKVLICWGLLTLNPPPRPFPLIPQI